LTSPPSPYHPFPSLFSETHFPSLAERRRFQYFWLVKSSCSIGFVLLLISSSRRGNFCSLLRIIYWNPTPTCVLTQPFPRWFSFRLVLPRVRASSAFSFPPSSECATPSLFPLLVVESCCRSPFRASPDSAAPGLRDRSTPTLNLPSPGLFRTKSFPFFFFVHAQSPSNSHRGVPTPPPLPIFSETSDTLPPPLLFCRQYTPVSAPLFRSCFFFLDTSLDGYEGRIMFPQHFILACPHLF